MAAKEQASAVHDASTLERTGGSDTCALGTSNSMAKG